MEEEEYRKLAGEIYAALLNRQGTVGEVDLARYARYAVEAAGVLDLELRKYIGEEEEEVEEEE